MEPSGSSQAATTGPGEQAATPGAESFALGSRAVALLAAEGLSLALCLDLLVLGDRATAFVAANAISPRARASLLEFMLAAGAGTGLAGLLHVRRRGAAATWELARRMAPALVAFVLPSLLDWRTWIGRDLHFLVAVGLSTLAFRSLVLGAVAPSHLGGRPDRPGTTVRPRAARLMAAVSARPAVVVSLAALAYGAFFAYHTIVYHRNVFSHGFDLGIFDNLEWNLVHGGPLFKASPAMGPAGSHLERHATFFAYVLAPFYALHPHPETLLLVQALVMGAAAVPLFLLARARIGAWPAVVVALAYLLYPPLHGANLADFHFLSLSPFFIWTLLHLVEQRRPLPAAVAFVMTLSLREDVAAGLVVLGVYLLWWGRRPAAGGAIALTSGLYFLVMKFGVMRLGATGESFLHQYGALVPLGGVSFGGVLRTVVGNPLFTLGTLLDAAKLVYALQLLVPLALLPLSRPIGLLFAVPGLVFTLLSTGYAPQVQISFQYTAHWTAYLFIALVLCLGHTARPRFVGDACGPARLRAALAGLVLGTVLASHQYGAVLQRNTARAGFDRFRFGTTAEDRERREELRSLVATIPPRARVAASETVVPHVSGRPDAYTLRLGTYDADYLLFSLRVAAPGEAETVRDALKDGTFGMVRAGSHFALARRGHGTGGNAEMLARLAHVEVDLAH